MKLSAKSSLILGDIKTAFPTDGHVAVSVMSEIAGNSMQDRSLHFKAWEFYHTRLCQASPILITKNAK